MSYRCWHGRMIIDDWTECSQCCAEHDALEASDITGSVLAEEKKQTALLERIVEQENRSTMAGEAVVTCPNQECGKLLSWHIERAGQKAECPFCDSSFLLPALVGE